MQTSKTFRLQNVSSSGCCSMLVKGSFQPSPQPPSSPSSSRVTDWPLFVALCTPTVNQQRGDDLHSCRCFCSVHRLDMSFTQVSDRYGRVSPAVSWCHPCTPGLTKSLSSSVLYFLGYSNEEMEGRSWYSLVHPEDLSSSTEFHQHLGKYPGMVIIQGSHEGFLMI